MHSYFPKEIFKQLDMDYRPYLTLVLIFLVPCTQRYEGSYYSEWIQGQNQNLEVRKLSLPTLQNLPSIERLHYMSFNMSFNADYLCLIKSEEDCQWQYKCCCDMYQRYQIDIQKTPSELMKYFLSLLFIFCWYCYFLIFTWISFVRNAYIYIHNLLRSCYYNNVRLFSKIKNIFLLCKYFAVISVASLSVYKEVDTDFLYFV